MFNFYDNYEGKIRCTLKLALYELVGGQIVYITGVRTIEVRSFSATIYYLPFIDK